MPYLQRYGLMNPEVQCRIYNGFGLWNRGFIAVFTKVMAKKLGG